MHRGRVWQRLRGYSDSECERRRKNAVIEKNFDIEYAKHSIIIC
jgi:hypothetical protein